MGFDLANFKKVHDDESKAIMKHPDGHTIAIAKPALSEKMKKQLGAMPLHKDEGGEIPEQDLPPQLASILSPPVPTMSPLRPPESQQLPDVTQNPNLQNSVPIQTNQPEAGVPDQSQPANNSIFAGQQATAEGQLAALGKQQAGIQQAAQVAKQQGAEEAQRYATNASAMHDLTTQIQGNLKNYNDEANNIRQDLADKKIDPHEFWGNKSTAGQVSTAIGLLLGGISSGLTGQENPALKFLNSQIDKNIDAQKANIGLKQNLLSAVYHQEGNMLSASNIVKSTMMDEIASQIKQTAAKYYGPQQQALANQQAAQIEGQAAALRGQVANAKAMTQLMQGGANVDPSQLVSSLVPKDHQKEVFNEIKTAQNATSVEGKMMSAFDQAAKDSTLWHVREPVAIEQMNALALPLIHDAEGRVNEFEQKTVKDLFPTRFDSDARIAEKRAALANFIENKKATPTAKGFGLDLKNFRSTAKPFVSLEHDRQALEWAKANPNTKEAKDIIALQSKGQ